MKKNRLIYCLLLSFLIHLGILFGIDVSLIPTSGMPEWPNLIPVRMVVIEEEEEGSSKSLTFKETGILKNALVARAQTAMGTPSATSLEDFPGPIPKEGTFKPSLNVEQFPTPGVLPPGQEGKEVESKRVVSRSLNPPMRLPAIPHSASDQSPLLEVDQSRVLTQAEKGGALTYSTKLEKSTAPLGRNRPHPEFVSDLLPIPTVSSPALPEEREMVLSRPEESLQPDIASSTTLRPLRLVKQTEKKIADRPWDTLSPGKVAPLEPLITDFEKRGAFVGPGKGFSILLVLDTSGSVKGPPLEGIKKSAMEFVNLLGAMDRCAVITFNDKASLAVPFTSDKNRLRQEIPGLLTEGRNTVLFDALDQAFLFLKKEEDKRRFVVLFSDGKDEGSQSTLHGVINRARNSHISVFCLGYSRVEKRYLKTLEGLSQRTGGIFAEAPHFREIVELFRAARDLRDKKES
ncbi:MAG: VWA domain-containing protein [Syntrophobacterales bacterium]|nr:MAG: VWA domain-containing protein [Syntrophobacterales bacterium]